MDNAYERVTRFLDEGRLAEAEWASGELPPDVRRDVRSQIAERSKRLNAADERPDGYHRWYYDNLVWKHRTWCGVPVLKSPLDMWNYQEIVSALRPDLIIEFGAFAGGSALYFAQMLKLLEIDGRVISVDISLRELALSDSQRTEIEFIEASSTSLAVLQRLIEARSAARCAFVILDSDHSKANVYEELLALRDLLQPGDYVIVEDGNINGHPVLPDWGEGPHEAITQYFQDFPDDYVHDYERERAFGWTFAPEGFLIRR